MNPLQVPGQVNANVCAGFSCRKRLGSEMMRQGQPIAPATGLPKVAQKQVVSMRE
jgi:hypothetical protein